MSKQNSTTKQQAKNDFELPSSLYNERVVDCPECNCLIILRPSLNEYQDIKYAFCNNSGCVAGGELWECRK